MTNKRKFHEPIALWEQQPDESTDQYVKFCRYRDMRYTAADGTKLDGIQTPFGKRSIRGLAVLLGMTGWRDLGKLSARFRWAERCDAYDVEIERQAREQSERAILKMRKDHADLAAQMIKKAAKRLLTIPEEEIEAKDIARLVDVGVKIERLSRGESTENKQISGEATLNHKGTVKLEEQNKLDLSGLSDEELIQLEKLLGKLHEDSE
ncbi:MAG: hypothetical protein LBS36_07720 [Oscillospiraceae bacterium]|jgi:hypothetical protein|nr:hypothetical protein [Oscillospiraceae bacterium]